MSRRTLVNREIDLDALAFAVARNHCGPREPIEAVLNVEGVTLTDFAQIVDDEVFKASVKRYTKELTENGVSFQLKARIQAEELLKRQYILIHDPETPPAVAVKAIENTVRWAGLEPKTSQQATTGTGAAFQIIFNIDKDVKEPKIIEQAA
jgi:hypothetical protein